MYFSNTHSLAIFSESPVGYSNIFISLVKIIPSLAKIIIKSIDAGLRLQWNIKLATLKPFK